MNFEKLNKNIIFSNISNQYKKNVSIEIFDSIDSTNKYLLKLISDKSSKELLNKNYLILAEKQFSGVGQFKREWVSPLGNIYFSMSYCFSSVKVDLKNCSVDIANCTKNVLEDIYGDCLSLNLKHPNDIFSNGKKLSGTLIETFFSKEFVKLVVGVGVNCYPFSLIDRSKISQSVTDLISITGQEKINRDLIVSLMFNSYMAHFRALEK